MPIPHYPSIVLLEKRPEIFCCKEVVATEKLHGSLFSMHFPMGMASLADVQFGSHHVEYKRGEKGFPLGHAIMWVEKNQALLAQMWEVIKSYGFSDATIFGEAYGPGIKSKGVRYSEGSEMLFRAFDLMVGENHNLVTWDLFCDIMQKMGLDRVHEVWRGDPTQEAFDALLGKPSTEAVRNGIHDPDNYAEGIVIRTNPLFRNVFGEWLIAKHKYGKFAEKKTAPGTPNKIKLPREASPVDDFVATFVTEGRVRNALGRLGDLGVALKNDMADMPALLKEIIADLHKECEPEWLATGAPEKVLMGAVSKVLAPIYRELLSDQHRVTCKLCCAILARAKKEQAKREA